MANKTKTICEEKVVPIIEEMGYDVIEVEYAKKSDGMNLTFFIDCDNGISADDCEKVSKVIDPILDEINPTDDQAYILNVSSPGIDRPIKSERDFKRNLGKEIAITLFAKQDGIKLFEGKLVQFDENSVTIQPTFSKKAKKLSEGQITIQREKIAHIVPIIKF